MKPPPQKKPEISGIRYIAAEALFIYIGHPIYEMVKRKETYCCDMRGLLSFLILFLLSKKTMHGQGIAEEIEKRKGTKPSPGTIYPALKSLKKMGLIDEQKAGKTIVYHLTKNGEKELEIAKKYFCKAFMDIFQG